MKPGNILIDALCCVICADIKVVRSERLALFTIAKKVKLPLTTSQVNNLLNDFIWRAKHEGLESLVQKTSKRLTTLQDAKLHSLFERCFDLIAKADGVIDPRELEVCRKFKEALNQAKLSTTKLTNDEPIKDSSVNIPKAIGQSVKQPEVYNHGHEQSKDKVSQPFEATNGWSPLHKASYSGNKRRVKSLLYKRITSPNIRNIHGQSPLHLAAIKGHSYIVKLLLINGALADVADNSRNRPIHYAAAKGHKQVVWLLMPRCTAINAMNSAGRTAIQVAADRGQNKVADMIKFNKPPLTTRIMSRFIIYFDGQPRTRTSNKKAIIEQYNSLPDHYKPAMKTCWYCRKRPAVPASLTMFLMHWSHSSRGFSQGVLMRYTQLKQKTVPIARCKYCEIIHAQYEVVSFNQKDCSEVLKLMLSFVLIIVMISKLDMEGPISILAKVVLIALVFLFFYTLGKCLWGIFREIGSAFSKKTAPLEPEELFLREAGTRALKAAKEHPEVQALKKAGLAFQCECEKYVDTFEQVRKEKEEKEKRKQEMIKEGKSIAEIIEFEYLR